MVDPFPWDPLDYPFDVPATSYRWSAASATALPSSLVVADVIAGRTPVLAIGSNASPRQLTRKFAADHFTDPGHPDGSIPVLRAVVDGVDVVYGAHLASYGSLPATLLDTPGARAHLFLTWLTPRQLERMHQTEGVGHAYQLRRVDDVECHGTRIDAALSYVTMDGVALLGGTPSALAAIACPGSPRPRATQRQAWDALSADMGGDGDGPVLLGRVLGQGEWRG